MFRLDPQGGIEEYKTYSIKAPRSTHFAPATCEQVNCDQWRLGWRVVCDETVPDGSEAAQWIRHVSQRHYLESKDEAGLTVFTFQPGQPCFHPHQRRLDKPELYLVRDGDFRGNPTRKQRMHARGEDWIDDFQNHQDRLAADIEKRG